VDDTELRQRLAAILAADVTGYSRLMAGDERATVAALDEARAVFRSEIESRHGRVIDMAGDSVLAVFETATGAVSTALAVQMELNASSSAVPEDRRMRFRIGIHLGDVIEKADGTIYGDGVNIAARLEGLAEPGGIAVSDSVRNAVRGKVKATFEDRGEQLVKNIPHPVRMFAIQSDDLAHQPQSVQPSLIIAPAQTRMGALFSKLKHVKGGIVAGAGLGAVLSGLYGYWAIYQGVKRTAPSTIAVNATADAGPLSIAVLPFANQTGDVQKTYIADALTTSITSDLSRIRDAFVIPPRTAFIYKDKPATMQQVGRELGVHFVLQGDVLTSSEKVRISAQLADAQSGAQLWTETFDGELTNLFALQDQVTTRIGNSIGREMVIVAARESETRKSSPKAADLMLRAKVLGLKSQSLKNWQDIEALYRQILLLEPNNSSAVAGVAVSLSLQALNYGYAMTPAAREKKFVEGRDLALKAKELDPGDLSVYVPLGYYAQTHDDYAGYLRAAQTRFSLQPKNPLAVEYLALAYFFGGEPRKAIELHNQAINLDPKHPQDVIWLGLGRAFFMLGDNDAAIEFLQKGVQANSTFPNLYTYLAMAYSLKGDNEKARAMSTELRRVAPAFRLSNLSTVIPNSSTPAAYNEFYEQKLLPAWRKAGLPE